MSRWKDTTWKISAIYTLNREVNFFKAIEEILKTCYGVNGYCKRLNLGNKKIYEFDIFSLTVQYDFDISDSDVVVAELIFQKVNITYKNANRRFDELHKIFHKLEETIHFSDKTYDISIDFADDFHNPFYGVAIQHLGEEHISNFECAFNCRIDITNSDFDIVKSCAKKCLLLK